jgi:glycosyltransferase involved in cell wall biosynthesis
VIIPTIGRRSLRHALESVQSQLRPGDELLVDCNDDGDMGSAARNRLVAKATGSHLVFLDDDDVFAEGALDRMRAFGEAHPGRIGLFRMRRMAGDLVWDEPVFAYGCAGSPTMVVPNVPGKVGTWTQTEQGNDWNFLEETVRLQGSEPVFVDDVVAHIRRHGEFSSRLARLRFRLQLRSRLRAFARSA